MTTSAPQPPERWQTPPFAPVRPNPWAAATPVPEPATQVPNQGVVNVYQPSQIHVQHQDDGWSNPTLLRVKALDFAVGAYRDHFDATVEAEDRAARRADSILAAAAKFHEFLTATEDAT